MRRARSSLNTSYRRPESVLVVVYTDDGETLLLQRLNPFSFWQSVTGSLDAGECPGDAARRELAEETGLAGVGEWCDTGTSRTFTIDPRWRHRYAPGVIENTEYEWRYRIPAAREISLDDEEHGAFRWVPIDEAVSAAWSWTNKEALVALQGELQRNAQQV